MRFLGFIGVWLLCIQSSLASIHEVEKKIDLDVQNQWRIFVQTAADSPDQGAGVLASLYQYQLEHKIDAMPAVSSLLLRKIAPEKDFIDFQEHPYWIYAKRFHPASPNPAYLICQQGKKTPLFKRASYCFQGLGLELKLFEGRLFYKAYLSHILYSTLLATIAIMFLLFLIKYVPFIFQYGSSRFVWLSPMASGALLCVLCVTLSLSFGWVFGMLLLSWLLWKFLDRIEKYMLIFLFAAAALVPYTFEAPAQYIQYQEQNRQDVSMTATSQELFHPPVEKMTSQPSYQHFIQTMYPRTFYRTNQLQLYITLVFGILVLLFLGMFNNKGDYFFIYQKRETYSKKMILKDLKAYPTLYFDFLKKLHRNDLMHKIASFILPPFYFFSQSKPMIALLSTFVLSFLFFALIHYINFFQMFHFVWSWVWGTLLAISLLTLWALPKVEKNRELYGQKEKNKK